MKDKKILTIQDISCYGQCSITVALPILSACGFEVAILPTSILSTHTSGFKNFRFNDLDNVIPSFLDHWKEENLKFDVIYTGYLGNEALIDLTIKAIDEFKKDNTLIVIDPAMGDKGKLYPAFNKSYALKMRELIKKADIIIPNLTEVCYLLDEEYKADYGEEYVKSLLKKLAKYTNAKIIVTDVSFKSSTTGPYIFDNGNIQYYEHAKMGEGYHGTGDIFASSFIGAYLYNNDIYESSKLAADYICSCIKNTLDDKSHWYGVKFEPILNKYVNQIKGE